RRPQDDVARVDEALRVDARGRPDRRRVGRAGAGVAVGALADGGAEAVEEPVTDAEPVQDPLVAQVADRHHGLAAVLGDPGLELGRDLRERLVPRDLLEPAAALRSAAP